jgi:hypothetical protein
MFITESTEYIGVKKNDGKFELSNEGKELDALCKDIAIIENYFEPNETGAIRFIYEMEMAWNTLAMDMMKIEHESIVKEDVTIIDEAMKDYWTKIVEFFKNIWKTLTNFVKTVYQKLYLQIVNVEKWWKNNAKAAAKAGSIEVVTDIKQTRNITDLDAKIIALANMKEKGTKEAEAIRKELAASKASGTTAKKTSVSAADVTKSLGEGLKMLSDFKNYEKTSSAIIKNAINTATAASKLEGSKSGELKAAQNQIANAKTALSINKEYSALLIQAVRSGVMEAVKVGKKLVSASKKAK